MKRTLIIANGELDEETVERLKAIQVDRLVAVDGGAEHCRTWGFRPDAIVGDLDSITEHTRSHFQAAGIPIECHPARKDETDLELAVFGAAEGGSENIILAGALGGRLDMTLANVMLLAHPRLRGVRVELWHRRGVTTLLRPPGGGISGRPGDTLSLIPVHGDVDGVSTEGLDYPLRNEPLHFGEGRGVSNVLTGTQATVHVGDGMLLAVHLLQGR